MAMPFPNSDQVKIASQKQLGRWLRKLPTPMSDEHRAILAQINDRFEGWTPAISKAVDWTSRLND